MKNETRRLPYGAYFELPNPNLRSYFKRVREGQPEEYRAPFAGKRPVQEILSEWEPHLKKIEDKWPTLVEFENDLRSKVGPMSIMRPLDERLEDIDHYYDDVTKRQTPISDAAVQSVIEEFSAISGMRLRSQSNTVKQMKLSTNSGSPFFTKRRTVLDKTYPARAVGNLQFLPSGEYGSCAVLGWRGQEGGPSKEDVKQRVVWMFPLAINILELQVYQVLIESCQRFFLVPAWISMDAVDRHITDLFRTKNEEDQIICTDFSKFDQHFNPTCQEAAKSILKGLFTDNSDMREWLDKVFPIKYNIPLSYDYGKIRFGPHGMGSGSGGTNGDETLTHRALQYEVAIGSGQLLNTYSMCLGDDGIISYPGITVEEVVESYSQHGLDMNVDKQHVSTDDCIYLRRWHHKDYAVNGVNVGVYSTYRAIGRLCEQERYYDSDSWGPKMVALRQLSIIENVKFHPLAVEFANWCMERDKYRLGLDIPGFLDNIEQIAKEATDEMPDFLGYTKGMQKQEGISGWWIVRYLKSLQ